MARDKKAANRPRKLDRVQREKRLNKAVLYSTIGVVGVVLGSLIVGLVLTNFVWPQQAIAVIGDTEISTRDYQKRVRYERLQLVGQYNQNAQILNLLGGGANSEQFQNVMQQIQFQLQPGIISRTVIEGMIDEVIIEQEAADRNIEVSGEEVDELLQSLFGYFPDGTPTPPNTPVTIATSTLSAEQLELVTAIPSATPFLTATTLATDSIPEEGDGQQDDGSQPTAPPANGAIETGENDVTAVPVPSPTQAPSATPTLFSQEAYEENLAELFESYEAQINFDQNDLREILHGQLLRDKVLEALTMDIEPMEEQVWARHILVADETIAQEVLERLNNGDTWNELAVEYSQDEGNKNEGGNLGWFSFDTMVEPFAQAAFALEIGEISEPTESAFGWHIIQVLGHENRLLNEAELDAKRNSEFSLWLADQREIAGVEILDFLEARTPDQPDVIPLPGLQQAPGIAP